MEEHKILPGFAHEVRDIVNNLRQKKVSQDEVIGSS